MEDDIRKDNNYMEDEESMHQGSWRRRRWMCRCQMFGVHDEINPAEGISINFL